MGRVCHFLNLNRQSQRIIYRFSDLNGDNPELLDSDDKLN